MILNPVGDSTQTITKTKDYYPITLTEAKRHLRVEPFFKDDDDLIDDLIESATGYCEDVIQKDIALTSNVVNVYNFSGQYIKIWEGNFNSLTSVLDGSTGVATVNTWPYIEYVLIETVSTSADPLTVNFKTGYSENACPVQIKQAILIKIADFYDVERQGYTPSVLKANDSVERLLSRYKNTRA